MARKRDEQLAAFDPPGGRQRVGRAERGVNDSVAAARKVGNVTADDAGLIASARVIARAMDEAERTRQVYAVPGLAKELRETLAAAGLTTTRVGAADAVEAFLAGLSDPALPDTGP